jgi:hypothetical protein
MVFRARGISKKKGFSPPTVTEKWILEQYEKNPRCFYTGVPLVLPKVGDVWEDHAPSLDRIDNGRGYLMENVRLTSLAWNRMRGGSTVEEALAWMSAAIKHMRVA